MLTVTFLSQICHSQLFHESLTCSWTCSLMSCRRALNWPHCHHMRWHSSPKCQGGHEECGTRMASIEKNKRRSSTWTACSLIIIYRSTCAMKNIQEIVFPLVQSQAFCTSKGHFFASQQLGAQGHSWQNSSSPLLWFSLLSKCVCATKHKLQRLSENSLKASEAKRKWTVAAMAQAFLEILQESTSLFSELQVSISKRFS